jgi:hypothetical protein
MNNHSGGSLARTLTLYRIQAPMSVGEKSGESDRKATHTPMKTEPRRIAGT